MKIQKNKVQTLILSKLIPLAFIGLTMMMTGGVEAQTGPGSGSFLCGSRNLFLSEVDMVLNVLDLMVVTRPRKQGEPLPRVPERMQCGLPGEAWNLCVACTNERENTGYEKVVPFLAEPRHRDWHFRWHSIRREISADGINNFPPDRKTLEAWKADGWIDGDIDKFVEDHRIGGRLSGEDFFFMHRQMIKMLQIEQSNAGIPCWAPWRELPNNVKDPKWPVPKSTHSPKPELVKQDQRELNELIEISRDLRRPEYLRTVSLSEFGTKVEALLHGKLHTFYSWPTQGCQNNETDNSVKCDDLTHDRTAHLNKYFWKLHGHIDQMLGDWLKANGKETIALDCRKAKNPATCQQWSGIWLGALPATSGRAPNNAL